MMRDGEDHMELEKLKMDLACMIFFLGLECGRAHVAGVQGWDRVFTMASRS